MMSGSKPQKLIHAEELIKAGKFEEARDIILKFQQTAWDYYSRIELDKALDVALQCKVLIEKIGEKIDIARNFFLIGFIYLEKRYFNESLDFALKSLELHIRFFLLIKIDFINILETRNSSIIVYLLGVCIIFY